MVLQKIKRFTDGRQTKAFLVGGFVRDHLLRRLTSDIDIAVTEDAPEYGKRLAGEIGGTFVLLDDINRIARVVIDTDRNSAGFSHFNLDFSTIQSDIKTDLARRDFSINSMAIDLTDFLERPDQPELIDPFQGQKDLQVKIIRAVTDDIFRSDPARLLRVFRLAAELNLTLDENTRRLVQRDAAELSRVAGERAREELVKLLASSEAALKLREMDELGILTVLFPELEHSRDVEQPKEHHWDVLNHSLETVSAAGSIMRSGSCAFITSAILSEVPWSDSLAEHFNSPVSKDTSHAVLVKLAALLHDIAKPETRIIDKERIRFFGHNEQGAVTVVKIMERLRFSNKDIRLVECMVQNHMRPTQMSQTGLPSRRAIYRFFRDTGAVAIDILFLSLADHLAARGPNLDPQQWSWHLQQVKYTLEQYSLDKSLVAPAKLVNGYDLMNELGLKPGPRLREILESVREAQAAGEICNRGEALSYIKNRLI
ncbi:MAG TPA: HDIG domain-containing protein [Dehalococcoidales bacterium]|nr:HDIG domain-containing protein [Dehalococcoidales bacterium]